MILLTLAITSILAFTSIGFTETYNPETSHMAFIASSAAYANNPQPCLDTLPYNCSFIKSYDIDFEDGNLRSFTGVCDDSIIISFRGTNTDTQLFWEVLDMGYQDMTQVTTFKVQTYFLKGFLKLYSVMKQDLYGLLDLYYNKHVYITAHSLGAALGSLLSTFLKHKYPNKSISLYTFGQPRVGDYNYAKLHNTLIKDSWRVVHRFDIVPHLPFCKVYGNCNETEDTPTHHGTEVFYDNDMSDKDTFVVCKLDEDPNCSNKYYPTYLRESMIYDHIYYFGRELANFGRSGCM